MFSNNSFKKNHKKDSNDLETVLQGNWSRSLQETKQPSVLYANSCQQVHYGVIHNTWSWSCWDYFCLAIFFHFVLFLFESKHRLCFASDSGRPTIGIKIDLLTLSVMDTNVWCLAGQDHSVFLVNSLFTGQAPSMVIVVKNEFLSYFTNLCTISLFNLLPFIYICYGHRFNIISFIVLLKPPYASMDKVQVVEWFK